MRPLRQLQRDLYLTQRSLGDADAATRGPGVLAKRLARRALTRTIFRTLRGIR